MQPDCRAEHRGCNDGETADGCCDCCTSGERRSEAVVAHRRWVPTMNISKAKPIAARPVNSGSLGSIHSNPLLPITTPAAISPTITGGPSRGTDASTGPISPAATTRASAPKLTSRPARETTP
jgi:hypothetical protein